MITKKVVPWHCLFWFFTLVDYTFIANWLAQQGIYEFKVNNKLGVHYLAFEIIQNIPSLLLHASLCYLNLLVIVPYFFKKQRYFSYIGCVMLVTAFVFLPLRYCIEEYFYSWLGGNGLTYTNKIFWVTDSSVYIFRIFFYGIAYYLTWRWVQTEKEKEEIKAQNITTELSFLKTQINPHFLFNTLTNLYSLAYKRSEKTADAILKLSDMMRYMLYDSNKKEVSVTNEVNYLFNFIELQKLRTSKPTYIHFSINESYTPISVAPLLLIPFVENVFKHGETNDINAPVIIDLDIQTNKLCFRVKNKIKLQQKDHTSGIGLANIKRRLELIYPEKHQLAITQSPLYYEVDLIIQFQ